MNSIACGESPSMFLRCSAPASFDNVSVYVIICFNDSSSIGSNFDSWGSAHFWRAILNYSKLLNVFSVEILSSNDVLLSRVVIVISWRSGCGRSKPLDYSF